MKSSKTIQQSATVNILLLIHLVEFTIYKCKIIFGVYDCLKFCEIKNPLYEQCLVLSKIFKKNVSETSKVKLFPHPQKAYNRPFAA